MEAINSLASVATKAIWGETNNNTTTTNDKDAPATPDVTKKEPISGVQGDTAKGEPFDAGNIENVDAASRTQAESKIKIDDKTEDESKPKTENKPEADPTVGDKPSSHMKDDSTTHQSDVRDPATTAEHHKEEKKHDVDNVEPLQADKLKGPGPKPLEVVARERGGDAGNTPADAKTDSPNPVDGAADVAKDDAEKKKDSPKLNEDGEPLGMKHISSTGVAADGGDFDAANPGAGAEAEKILHDKGIHTDKPAADKKEDSPTRKAVSPSGKSTGGSPDRKGIRGLGHKIKDKLRRSSQS
ncbi:hypothetical protein MCOR25_010897 [Pyricularia grisea]|uniref:Uncharacterized protein n=1 Tax=Pyricularia grisea TaxID=148305 RepID=A0A6P8AUL5_PYRGI|nr:uncharacterized protein PgNI_08967 [Pyricularia grisea]KAI6347738.1 hypothetical protein MCOR25_010897 [Pyricularia grisea]TLD05911.1 hypothetical protein PgNI_08967 [Pyricularia grisea]